MKTIGLLGGMSWESTVSYYQVINRDVNRALGGHHSAKIALISLDFAEVEAFQHQGRWEDAAGLLADAAWRVQEAGADLIVLCTNTMHKVARDIEKAVDIPLLHIADATADALIADGVKRVGLLGTCFTMEQGFYKDRLEAYGIEVQVPEKAQRDQVHRIIYDELCHGEIEQASRQVMLSIMEELKAGGAEAVILGCTEIALLVAQADTEIPLYDTTAIHARRAVELALG
ncbi:MULTISPECIES: aspartate/glutamate racemase family protein [unclassified Halomonas]|uniref:Aspartate/glutamate racemase family protein n=2 Tax=unclassified Halomonas TaxID=2609666 RepID=A0AAU7KF39_9GAMM|nr:MULTISPECIES: aspartate/glutamate racemase family protein [unclassified Halomonas]MAR72718.1 aspartate racemase [Halomonas sp.]MBR9772886.1 aspartate/glutamate racemase family protein [Gammaproteobacteria bacterium]MBY5940437.1 aspartate/glutamate racemase family protein [Halomonas sp. DP5N14-9]HAR07047.1 aspartate racemase [Cobetia sp.]|tara:strand:- start:1148 stop:1837 length:690 start_codon:yes stop_codon:yes gene_type:complete